MDVFLLRHFESKISETGVFSSDDNCGLSENGKRSALQASLTWARLDVEVLCSPYERVTQSCDLLGLEYSSSPLLREWDLGSMQGLHAATFRQANPMWNLFVDGPYFGDGESLSEVLERADSFIGDYIQARRKTNDTVLLATHGQFAKIIIAKLLNFPLWPMQSVSIAAGSLTRISLSGEDARLHVLGAAIG